MKEKGVDFEQLKRKLVKEDYADTHGVDVDEIDIDFQIDDPEPTDFARGGLAGVLGV